MLHKKFHAKRCSHNRGIDLDALWSFSQLFAIRAPRCRAPSVTYRTLSDMYNYKFQFIYYCSRVITTKRDFKELW